MKNDSCHGTVSLLLSTPWVSLSVMTLTNVPLVKRLQISGDGAASALCPEEEQTSRNSGTSQAVPSKHVNSQGQNPYPRGPSSRRLLRWERRLFSSTLVPQWAYQIRTWSPRGFHSWEIAREWFQDWRGLQDVSSESNWSPFLLPNSTATGPAPPATSSLSLHMVMHLERSPGGNES